jgi:kinesin family protein 11
MSSATSSAITATDAAAFTNAAANNNNNAKGTNVQVAVRCRPLNAEEKKAAQPCVVACDSEAKAVRVNYGPMGKKTQKSFNFDKVFGMYSTQEEVFDQVVRPIVDEALAGFNCTIFAYGQTGTGKTHTMEGDIHSEENAGIVPRSVKWILEQLETSGAEFTIRVSFLELCKYRRFCPSQIFTVSYGSLPTDNEELQDLLAKPSDDKKLKLCEDVKKGVVCQNLEEITVLNVVDIFEILQRGIQQRITAETLCNKNSSRSHSIFTLKIMIKECNVEGEEVVRHGQLNLVDLAGSECVGRSGAKDNRAREAGSINQSLLTLGRVITALVDHHGHIPYRDSKLTRLLQESLGGKAKTCIIATLSPSQLAVEESMSTLDYAHRAKNIKNQPTVNQKSTKKVVLKEYCQEIESLKSQLQLTREKNGVYVDPAEFYAMETRLATQESQITECESALKVKSEEVKVLKSERDGIFAQLDETQQALMTTESKLEVVTECYEDTKKVLQTTEEELKATNAVVGEQVATESTLHEQGAYIQRELTNRREDVDGLLAKIDRHSSSETARLEATAKMIGKLSKTRLDINQSSAIFKESTDQQAEFLRTGVSDMLGRSRQTCDKLRIAIDGALQTLIGDANIAKDSMTTSCAHLDNHLHATEDNIAKTLLDIKGQLSSWLGDVDTAMKTAQSFVAEQQKQLDVMTESVALKSIEYVDQCEQMLKTQESQSMAMLMENRELRSNLISCVDSFDKEHEAQLNAASEAMKSKATEIELVSKITFVPCGTAVIFIVLLFAGNEINVVRFCLIEHVCHCDLRESLKATLRCG